MQRMGTGVFVPRSSGHQQAAATRPSHAHTALQPADAGSVSALSDADACSPLCVPVSIQHSSGIPPVSTSLTGVGQIPGSCALSALNPTGPIASTHGHAASAGPLAQALPSSAPADRRSLDSVVPQCPSSAVPAAAPLQCGGHSKPPLGRHSSPNGHYGPFVSLFATTGSQPPEGPATDLPLFAAVTASSPQAPPAGVRSPFAMHAGHMQVVGGTSLKGASSAPVNSLLQLQAPLPIANATSIESVLWPAALAPATIPETWYTSTAGAAVTAVAADQQTLNRSSSASLAAPSSLLAGQPQSSTSLLAALSCVVGSLEGSPAASSTALSSPVQLLTCPQSSGLLLLQDSLSLGDMDLQQMSEDDISGLAADVAQGKMAQIEQLKAMQRRLRQEVISLLPLI